MKKIITTSLCLLTAIAQVGGLGLCSMTAEAGEKPGRARRIVLKKKYLLFPVKAEYSPTFRAIYTNMSRVELTIDGKTARMLDVELAPGKPSFWCFLDITPFKGKTATLTVRKLGKGDLPANETLLGKIVQGDEIPGADQIYKEKLRQQFHFSSRRGWNNDPNGLVYYKGEYHLYYQHNPYGWKWCNMQWGHAVSRDLVHWKELPVAIYPHPMANNKRFGAVFSGSAAVDWKNAAGFKAGENDVIVAAYTGIGRGECIAYSNDRGRTFTDYKGNPVVKHSGRDPKIFWYAPGKHWVMAVYDQWNGRSAKGIAFYNSPDLKKWEFRSRIGGYYECPEIFELPVDGNKKNTRWVVYGADGAYSVGRFDGKVFRHESGKHRGNYGNCSYASQTFNDIPAEDGRRIQIAWGKIATPDMPFNQCMLFPCELTLRTTDEGIRMFAKPVREIETLHARKHAWKNRTLKEGENLLSGIKGELFDIRAEFEVGDAEEFGFVFRNDPAPVKPPLVRAKVRADSQETAAGSYEAFKAMDGDPDSIWCTDWRSSRPPHPHEIVVDLGGRREITGFTYLPRTDASNNGTIKDYEVYLSDRPEESTPLARGTPVAKGTFARKKGENVVKFAAPVRGRYFRLRSLSAVGGGICTTMAELRPHCEGVKFVAGKESPTRVTYNVKHRQLACGGSKAPLKPEKGKIRMQILVDRNSVEVFGNDGRVYIPIRAVGDMLSKNSKSIELFSRGGNTKLVDLAVYELKSAWE